MPPPRLAQSLRPCHPRGPAHQARRVSQTARVQSSTDRGDRSGSGSSTGNGETTEGATGAAYSIKRTYAKFMGRMSGIASPAFEPVSTEPTAASTSQNTPSAPPEHPKSEIKGNASPGPRIKTHRSPPVESQETQRRKDGPLRTTQGRQTETRSTQFDRPSQNEDSIDSPKDLDVGAIQQGSPGFKIRKHISKPGLARKHISIPGTTRETQQRIVGPLRSTHGSQDETRSTQFNPSPQNEHPIDSLKELGADTIRKEFQLLQQLYERVEKLHAALETKITTAESTNKASNLRELPHETTFHAPNRTAITRSANTRNLPHPRYSDILKRAWAGYRRSTTYLIRTVKGLELMSPRVAGPIVSFVSDRLHVIALDARKEQDKATSKVLRLHSKSLQLLALGLKPSIDPPSSNPVVSAKIDQDSLDIPLPEASSPTQSSSQPKSTVKYPSLELSGPFDKSSVIPTATPQRQEAAQPYSSPDNRTPDDGTKSIFMVPDKKDDGQKLTGEAHIQVRLMGSSEDSRFKDLSTESSSPPTEAMKGPSNPTIPTIIKPSLSKDELSEQTLLEELFPETRQLPKPRVTEKRDQYPKLELPDYAPIVRRELVDVPKSRKEQIIESFQSKGEPTTVLQLAHCSTKLTEADFSRLIPKGKHIELWRRGGEFFKIIPGRDPLSLERMPFYYILFKDPESALAYQKNVSRLHKLSALHQPSDIFSAIPPPKGFLEDGEDLNKITSSYNLLPTHHHLSLFSLMQPYHPALRSLIDRGGYQPIVPDVDAEGNRITKVLLHIEGYEPTPSDLFEIFRRDAYVHGMSVPFRNESSSSIHRLRDMINLNTSFRSKAISSARPHAYSAFKHDSPAADADAPLGPSKLRFDDPGIESFMHGADEDISATEVHQMMMHKVYNRWILDFSDEDAAQRFVSTWHRKVLPELRGDTGMWQDAEEVRFCNAEVLW